MARTAREPDLINPIRTSNGSTTPLKLIPNRPTTTKSIPSSSKPHSGSKIPRKILGERFDNVDIVPSTSRLPKKQPIKIVTTTTPTTTQQQSHPQSQPFRKFSSLILQSSPPVSPSQSLLSTPRQRSSTPQTAGDGRDETPSKTGRRETPPLRFDEDQTMLFDVIPGSDNAWDGLSETDASEVDDERQAGPVQRKFGRGVVGAGRMMTPVDSQESNPLSQSLSRFIRSPLTVTRNPISRLPTPPSSQSSTGDTAIVIPTSRTEVRARPADTPPRRVSPPPTTVVHSRDASIGDRQGPSPNPRRKKTPRLSDTPVLRHQPSVISTVKRRVIDRVEIVINSRPSTPLPRPLSASTSTSSDAPTTTSKGKGKARASLPRRSILNRSSEGAATSSITPKTPKPRASTTKTTAPRTAPQPKRHPLSNSTTSKTPKSRRKSLNPTRSTSLTASTSGVSVSTTSRAWRSLTPAAQRKLRRISVGVTTKPVVGSPGDDPLLLIGLDEELGIWPRLPHSGVGPSGLSVDIGDDLEVPGEKVDAGPPRSAFARVRNTASLSPPPLQPTSSGTTLAPELDYDRQDLSVQLQDEETTDIHDSGHTTHEQWDEYLSDDSTVIHSDDDEDNGWGGGVDDTFMNLASRRLQAFKASTPPPNRIIEEEQPELAVVESVETPYNDGYEEADSDEEVTGERDDTDDWGMGNDTFIRLMRRPSVTPNPIHSAMDSTDLSPTLHQPESPVAPLATSVAPQVISAPVSKEEEDQRSTTPLTSPMVSRNSVPTYPAGGEDQSEDVLDPLERTEVLDELSMDDLPVGESVVADNDGVVRVEEERNVDESAAEVEDLSIENDKPLVEDEVLISTTEVLIEKQSNDEPEPVIDLHNPTTYSATPPLEDRYQDGEQARDAEVSLEVDLHDTSEDDEGLRMIVEALRRSTSIAVLSATARSSPAVEVSVEVVNAPEDATFEQGVDPEEERNDQSSEEITLTTDGKDNGLVNEPVPQIALPRPTADLTVILAPPPSKVPDAPSLLQLFTVSHATCDLETPPAALVNEEAGSISDGCSDLGDTTLEATSAWDISIDETILRTPHRMSESFFRPTILEQNVDESDEAHDVVEVPVQADVVKQAATEAVQEDIGWSASGSHSSEKGSTSQLRGDEATGDAGDDVAPSEEDEDAQENHGEAGEEDDDLEESEEEEDEDARREREEQEEKERQKIILKLLPRVVKVEPGVLGGDRSSVGAQSTPSLSAAHATEAAAQSVVLSQYIASSSRRSISQRPPTPLLINQSVDHRHSSSGPSVQRPHRSPSAGPSRLSFQSASIAQSRSEAESSRSKTPSAGGGVVRQSRRSLHEELVDAGADTMDEDVGNDSFKSVVEVSSLDPRAAARAAAILKLNHAYIEHGVLPPSQSSTSPDIHSNPLPGPNHSRRSRSRSHRHRRSRSAHFASIETASKLDKDQLLLEAELEIVNSRRSRTRSISRYREEESEAETEVHFPGGYVHTPRKRKRRSEAVMEQFDVSKIEGSDGKIWGVDDWKRLEKIFKSEREIWLKEREVKTLPGGLFGWARSAAFGEPKVKVWEGGRVVDRFLKEEGIQEAGLGGEWEKSVIELRVQALERKSDKAAAQSTKQLSDHAFKRTRVESSGTPVSSQQKMIAGPPSTIRRFVGYVFPGYSAIKTPTATASSTSRPENKLLARLREIQDEPSPQVDSSPLPMREAGSSFAKINVRPVPAPLPTSKPVPSFISQSRPSLPMLSSTPAASRQSLYPALIPPMTQRSNAIKALFPETSFSSSSSTFDGGSRFATGSNTTLGNKKSMPAPINLPLRRNGSSSSVKDLVKSFEDQGILSRSLEKSRSGRESVGSSGSLTKV